MKINPKIVAVLCVLLIAAVAAGAYVLKPRKPVQDVVPTDIFSKGAENKDFIQISFYTIAGFENEVASGSGRVRYSHENVIYSFGRGNGGSQLTVEFSKDDENAGRCAVIAKSGIPYKHEFFVAGEGESDISPADAMQGAARIKFTKISQCAFIEAIR